MFLRTLAITVFLLLSLVLKSSAYPDYLLKQPYKAKYYWADSLYEQLRSKDSATAFGQVDELINWANSKGDKEIYYELKLTWYHCLIFKTAKDNLVVEREIPLMIDEIDDLPAVKAHAYTLLGNYFWNDSRKFSLALENSLSAYELYSKLTAEQYPLKAQCLYDLGTDYYRFRDYTTAITYLMESKATKQPGHNPNLFNIYNTIGLCYRHLEMYDSAEHYFMLAFNDVKLQHVKIWEGIIGGNLGITYYLEKRYTEAIPLLEKDIAICTEGNRLSENAANSQAVLGDIYLILGDKAKGMALLQDAYSKVQEGRKWSNFELQSSIFPRLAKAYALTGNYQMAYNFSDSAKRVSDSDARQKNALIVAGAQQKLSAEKHREETQKHMRERKVQVLIWVFLVISILLLVLVIFFILRNYNIQKRTNISLFKEKKRSDDLLLNILPVEVADELKATGGAVAKHFDHVTVLFTDFVNFTQAGERMSPQQLIDELHTCFKTFDEIISKYGIEKIKTIGDAYLAVAGLPVSDPAHAENVVRAALEIRDFMLLRKGRLGERTFDIRIGIHSGSVVAGIVGVKKFAYDIWGDTVNTAARMEQNSDAGKINVSQTTFELVKDKYACTYRGEIQAKNKGGLKMYFVEAMIRETAKQVISS